MLTASITTIVICGAAALAGGFIDAIAGGGALLTIPALLLCGVPPHNAIGTNKIGAVCGVTAAMYNFARHGLINWRMVAIGVPFSIIGSWLGSLLALHLDVEVLGKVIVVLLPVGIAATLMPPKKAALTEPKLTGAALWALLPMVAFSIGVYDGFFGPGTGSLLILAFHWIFRIDLLAASGDAKAFNMASNLSATISFIWHGVVLWAIAIPMAICFTTGSWLGSVLAIKAGSAIVRKFLLISLGLLMASLIWRYFIAPLFE